MTTTSAAEPSTRQQRRKGVRGAAKAAKKIIEQLSDADIRFDQAGWAEKFEAWCAKTAPKGYYFDEREAALGVDFFSRYLRHTKGKWYGKAFELELWQRTIVRMIFGWKRPDKTRRFRIVYLEVGRKNGKTGLAAGIALKLAFADGEYGAEVYSAANDTTQASIAFNEAKMMRAQSAALQSRTLAHKLAIVSPKTNSVYRVLSSDAGTKDGLNAHGFIFDELHALKDRLLYEVLHTSIGAREQPLEFLITTAGTDEESFCYEQHEYALRVLAREIEDPEFLPIIFAADAEDDIQDPKTWIKANPSIGVTISVEYIRNQAARARQLPRYENAFKRLHLNIWTQQVERWIPMDLWDKCRVRVVTLDMLKDREVWGGMDLSANKDLTCLALVSPQDERVLDETTGEMVVAGYDVWLHCWLPKEGLAERIKRDRLPYDEWHAAGLLTLTPGNVTDYDLIRLHLTGGMTNGAQRPSNAPVPIFDQVPVRDVGIDPWNATQLSSQMIKDGVNVVTFRQGFASMSAPSKEFERVIIAGSLNHGGNPILRAAAQNVTVKTDEAENIKPVKPTRKTSTKRVDPIIATVIGIGRAMTRDQENPNAPAKAEEVFGGIA